VVATGLFGRVDVAAELSALRRALTNYSVLEVARPAWDFDTHRSLLPSEQPGAPEPDGVWETACRLIERYEFSAPQLVRASYDPTEPLLGRNMLLQARFHGLHFYLGVRVTSVIDEARADGDRAWGWAYETLEGHLERGKATYEVVKRAGSGQIEFVITSYSQRAPTLGPITRLGWRLFGRRTQLRFYRDCGRRLHLLVEASRLGRPPRHAPATADGLVLAPSDARTHGLDRIALHRAHPGRLPTWQA
jgi:uncharacterized protein (UPF0548 family)